MRFRQRQFAAARLALSGAAFALLGAAPVYSQEAPSREVVQPLPNPAAGDLTTALQRVSANSSDVEALLMAGRASLRLQDPDAALGFFTRARDLGTAGGRAKAGIAAALVYKKMPVEALKLFAEAEADGASPLLFAGDYGLAFDLVGDNAKAQNLYRLALRDHEDPEITRRMALSQAIGGDQAASEATLLPLLQHQDLAAYRTRAFALAALGKTEDAVTIAEAIMPASLAARISPYLRYMPKLTRAQQAAAANFGHFPEASAIGKDDPRIAELARSAAMGGVVSSAADGRLVPVGQPLGRIPVPQAPPPPSQAKPAVAGPEPATTAPPQPVERVAATAELHLAELPADPGGVIEIAELPPATAPARSAPAAIAASEPEPEALPVVAVPAAELPPAKQAAEAQQPEPEIVTDAAEQLEPGEELAEIPTGGAPSAFDELPEPGFSLATRSGAIAAEDIARGPATDESAVEDESQEPASLADAFADFGAPPPAAEPAPGAVDITAIEPVREAKPEPAKAPPKPVNPKRFWVQVATGRDRSALGFDWRRIVREGGAAMQGKDGFVVRWGQTNRLVTGPFDSQREALDFVKTLKAAGLDTFAFTSDEGQAVDPLPRR